MQVSGRIAEVTHDGVLLAVDEPLPRLAPHIRFGVEIFGQTGLSHFHSLAAAPVEVGATCLKLALPDKVETVQRRRFARAHFSGEVIYQLVHHGRALQAAKGFGIDLSAGGLRMATTTPVREGQELLLHFETPDGRAYRGITSRVVRVESANGRCIAACRFEALGETQEAALVQAVFRLQLRNAAMIR